MADIPPMGNFTFVCRTPDTFQTTMRWIICILIAISNLLTIIAVLKSGHKIGQKAKLYILSLSCADLLLSPSIGLIQILYHAKAICLPIGGPYIPPLAGLLQRTRLTLVTVGILFVLAIGSSFFTLFSLAVDRLVAVSKPLYYKNHVSIFKIKCWLAFVWSYNFVLIGTPMIYFSFNVSPSKILNINDGLAILPTWCMSYLIMPHLYFSIIGNILLYGITLIYLKKLDTKMKNLKSDTSDGGSERTKRYIRMGCATLGFMLLLWSPYVILKNFINVTDPSTPRYLIKYIMPMCFIAMYSNSCVNPIIYCWMNKDYRKAYLDALGLGRKSNVITVETSMTMTTAA